MPRTSKFVVALAAFVALVFFAAPEARAEHIFFDVSVNGVEIGSSRVDEVPALRFTSNQVEAPGPVIVAADGRFTFAFRVFRDFGDPNPNGSGTLFVNFEGQNADDTLPPPLTALQLPFNITDPRQNPQVFSFDIRYTTFGQYSGSLTTRLLTADQDETNTFTFTLVVPPTTPVPEPTTLMLLGMGLVGVVALKRRRRKTLGGGA